MLVLRGGALRLEWSDLAGGGPFVVVEDTSFGQAYFVIETVMETHAHRPTWKTLLAFGIIYFVWGSTFLAIRVGVREVPPFLLAGMRFFVAGLVVYVWAIAKGESSPTKPQGLRALFFFISF